MYLVDDEVLFTGDSLSWDPDRDDLWAERYVCWWSWVDQLDSLERLTNHHFVRIVPTHGAISPALDAQEMRDRLSPCDCFPSRCVPRLTPNPGTERRIGSSADRRAERLTAMSEALVALGRRVVVTGLAAAAGLVGQTLDFPTRKPSLYFPTRKARIGSL